ncbi:hypothetical protein DE146DRAFT_681415 [Phaeosphaeria sp. MPI-PUGE-AT-0046c]|nr:hypothetical protein DE146DRAFT_681415 [Phaeosphaeria sp. MPI-PUGE-AT-0046c]
METYYSDSEPDFHIGRRADLTRPLVSNTARLQDPHLQCDRNLGWNIDWATAYLVDYIAKKHDAAESLRDIRIKAANLAREGLRKAIPFRVFSKLSETLFAGHLTNAVYLDSRRLDSDVSGATYTQSWGPVSSIKRVSIILNSNVLAHARARDVVAILIHHMIHAFFLVACGPQKEEEVSYGRLGHGFHFGMVMYTVKELSAVCGNELDSLDYGHPFTGDRHCRRRGRSGADEEREKWYCSHCHAHVSGLSQGQVETWYEKYIAPMHAQSSQAVRLASVQVYNERRCELETEVRARMPDCTETVEIVYGNTATLLRKSDVERNALSVLRAILATKSRYLNLESKDISSGSLEKLIELLNTGEWRPVMAHIRVSSSGAPVVVSNYGISSSTSTTPILDDITMAKSFSFSEILTYALSRLHAYNTCAEDPIALLDALYAGREPHYTLKEWSRCFLTKRDTQGVMNIHKLHSSPAFAHLVERCGGLENEVRKVVERNTSSPAPNFADTSPFHMLEAAGAGQQQQQLLLNSPLSPPTFPFPPISHLHTPLTFPYSPALPLPLERGAPHALGREGDRLRDTQAQAHAVAMLERFYRRGLAGFVEDGADEKGY